VQLYLEHPLVWGRTCDDCERYVYLEDGQLMRRPARTGLPVLRPRGQLTPCPSCPKIHRDAPARTRVHADEMTPRNRQAFWHYRQCKAVGIFPDDPVVRRNAAVVAEVIDLVNQKRQDELNVLLLGVLARGRR
jgi:hypothetical protein